MTTQKAALIATEAPPHKSLVVGSLSSARDGKYQSLVSELERTGTVERQMLDRLVDGATALAPGTYTSIHITLDASEYEGLSPRLPAFLAQLYTGLAPSGTLHLLNLPAALERLPSELTLAGFAVLDNRITMDGVIISQRPVDVPGASFALKSRRQSNKKALWTLSAPSTPIIDPEQLLTEADRARPAACEPVLSGAVPRRKKACKGCTCGLAELEAEERARAPVVLLDGAIDGRAIAVSGAEKERLLAAAAATPKATSSCGNCFLGDAFRCASCPYMGLPAFKPGEKVEIDLGMDDI